MKLAIMTRPTFFVEEDKILEALFDEGLDDLHIFKPNSSPLYVERLLSLLPENTHRRITVHHHFYLKEEFGLAGIHLDDATMEKPDGYRGSDLQDASRQGLIDKHVYALGGISIDRVRMMRDLGFGGVVICGDLWNLFDIHNQTDYKSVLTHFERLRSAIS